MVEVVRPRSINYVLAERVAAEENLVEVPMVSKRPTGH